MGAGSDWLKRNNKVLSPFGEQVADMVGVLFDGIYHISREVIKADWSNDRQVVLSVSDTGFSTYDSDLLTRLVLLAHDRNIRATIEASTHGYFKIIFVGVDRNGFFADRHPTLQESISRYSSLLTQRAADVASCAS